MLWQTAEHAATFQLTTSRRGRPKVHFAISVHGIFQLTTSRRGRRDDWGSWIYTSYHFNSLPHAEVDRGVRETRARRSEFQLTTSRRGRLYVDAFARLQMYFNSLPHAEVDRLRQKNILIQLYFNSLPHAEVDYD